MNWPAPSTLEPPPTPPSAHPPVESDRERRRLSAVPAAAWVALLGGSLLVLAAVAVVVSNWDTIGMSLRVAGLAVATAGLLAGAERLRAVAPTTAGVVAHVGTFLTASVGIAALSLFGVTWPLCLTIGGIVLAAVSGWQSDRWRRSTMHLGQVAGVAMLVVGVATLAGATAGLVGMLVAVAFLIAGGERRAVALSLLALCSPALTALADVGIGAGALGRAGLVGERLGWSGPIVGVLAGTVIAAVALRRSNDALLLIAAASPVVGVVTGLASVDGSVAAWWCVPALALVLAEIALASLPTDRWLRTIESTVTTAGASVATVALGAPLWVSLAGWGSDSTAPYSIPTALTGVALALTARRWQRADSRLADLAVAGVAVLTLAVPLALGAHPIVVAVVAIVALVVAAGLSRRLAPLPVHVTGAWALLAAVTVEGAWSGPADAIVPLVMVATVVVIVLAARARLAAQAAWPLAVIELAGITLAGTLGVLGVTDWPGAATGFVSAVVIVTVATLLDRRHRFAAIGVTVLAALVAGDAATATGSLEPSYALGWVVAAVGFAAVGRVHGSRLATSASAASAVFALAAGTAWFGATTEDVTVMAMLATVAATGVAAAVDRRGAVDAAAVAAGGVLPLTTAFDQHPAWASGAWFVFGLQVAVGGTIVGDRRIHLGGVALAIGAAVSWWFTSGLHEWAVTFVEPADIRSGDLWAAAASLAALATGIAVRRSASVNSWIAYGAALGVPGLWLTGVHLDRDTVWALPLMLTIGVGAAATGAWHRLAAPLVGGTALTALATMFAIGSGLTSIPVWVWLAIGGADLLGMAVVIERTGGPGRPDLRALVSRWS